MTTTQPPALHPPITCQWFAKCDHLATAWVRHPIILPVPTCARCIDRMGLEDRIVNGPTDDPRVTGGI